MIVAHLWGGFDLRTDLRGLGDVLEHGPPPLSGGPDHIERKTGGVMSEIPSDSELSDIESLLRGLTPNPSALDRDRLMFQAGALSRSSTRHPHWIWPSAAAVLSLVVIGESVFLASRPATSRGRTVRRSASRQLRNPRSRGRAVSRRRRSQSLSRTRPTVCHPIRRETRCRRAGAGLGPSPLPGPGDAVRARRLSLNATRGLAGRRAGRVTRAGFGLPYFVARNWRNSSTLEIIHDFAHPFYTRLLSSRSSRPPAWQGPRKKPRR